VLLRDGFFAAKLARGRASRMDLFDFGFQLMLARSPSGCCGGRKNKPRFRLSVNAK
jgi:hypothetical protein